MYRFREGGERPYRMQRRSFPYVLVFVEDTKENKKEMLKSTADTHTGTHRVNKKLHM